jgi:hypothetical protein
MTETDSLTIECPTKSAVLQTLAYFAVFAYPLTRGEVFTFCRDGNATQESVSEELDDLVHQGLIFAFDEFFQLKNEASWVPNRLDCNRRAEEFLPIARRMARFIAQFPFVRGVFVSGSLSKHCMSPGSDIDFFIVTVPGRLWLARTLLVVFKKIFLLNSHKYFCVNYFVDTEHLEIEEKNLFTATESVTLLPMWGLEGYQAFYSANTWAWQYYPHFPLRPTVGVASQTRGFFKKTLEKLLAEMLGNWLDQKAMRLTVGFWKKKFRGMNSSDFDLALKSRRGVSKHHPLHFQQKVLERFEENLRTLNGPQL